MTNRWQEVWRRRQRDPSQGSILAQLIAADGFNGFGKVEEHVWLDHMGRIAARLRITPGDSIFDVGCGAGAFLYPFYQQGHPVGGLDYAENLVNSAQETMPGAPFNVGEAVDLAVTRQFDVVVAYGVFLYFPDYAYAATVLHKMVQKARQCVGILDIPDLAKQEEALALRVKMLGEETYRQKYAGLDHLFFAREWFVRSLSGMGLAIQIEDQAIPGYLHSSYRFNVFVTKT